MRLELEPQQRAFIVALCVHALSAVGEMLVIDAFVFPKYILISAVFGVIAGMVGSRIMVGLYFAAGSVVTVCNMFFFWLFGAMNTVNDCNLHKDDRCHEAHIGVVCMGLQIVFGVLSCVLAMGLLLQWNEKLEEKKV